MYIKRSDALNAIGEKSRRKYPFTFAAGMAAAENEIKAVPSANVRPVVTCGECKYWKQSVYDPKAMACTYFRGVTYRRGRDEFCSRGERLTNQTEVQDG